MDFLSRNYPIGPDTPATIHPLDSLLSDRAQMVRRDWRNN